VCFTGEAHPKNKVGAHFRIFSNSELSKWQSISALAGEFSTSILSGDWKGAAHFLSAECALRDEVTPGCLSPRAKALAAVANQSGAGCRFAGHGHGGSVWAIGETNAILETMQRWRAIAKDWPRALVIAPSVAEAGLAMDECAEMARA
jgi:hypothetical protein